MNTEQTRKKYESNKYSGRIYCGICGAPFALHHSSPKKMRECTIYRCHNHNPRNKLESSCPKTDLLLPELDGLIRKEVQKERRIALALTKEMNDKPDSLLTKLLAHFSEEAEKLYQPVRECNKKHFSHFMEWQNGSITEETYANLRTECLKEEERLTAIWKEKHDIHANLRSYFSPKNTWIRTMLSLSDDFAPNRKELKDLIFRITIYEDNRLEIIWRCNLMRERLYLMLKEIDALPEGFINPVHRGCCNTGLYAYSKEELAWILKNGSGSFLKRQDKLIDNMEEADE